MFVITDREGKTVTLTDDEAHLLVVQGATERLNSLKGMPSQSIAVQSGLLKWKPDHQHLVFLHFNCFRALFEDSREWHVDAIHRYYLSKGLSMNNVTVFASEEELPSLGDSDLKEYLICYKDEGGGLQQLSIKAVNVIAAVVCLWRMSGADIKINEVFEIGQIRSEKITGELYWPEYWTLPVGWYDFFEEYYRIKRMKTQNQIQKTIKQGAMNSFLMVFETEFSAYFGGIKPLEISDRMHYSKPYLKLKLPFTDLVLNIPKI